MITMGVDANSGVDVNSEHPGSRLGLVCSGPRVYQIFGALGACWFVLDRILTSFAHTHTPLPLLKPFLSLLNIDHPSLQRFYPILGSPYSGEETRLHTEIGSKIYGKGEDELTSRRVQPGKEAFVMPRRTSGEAIGKGFEIIPVKFCLSAEYEEDRSSIVNFSAAFQLIPSILWNESSGLSINQIRP